MSTQYFAHLVRGLALHLWYDVAIRIHGQFECRVSSACGWLSDVVDLQHLPGVEAVVEVYQVRSTMRVDHPGVNLRKLTRIQRQLTGIQTIAGKTR